MDLATIAFVAAVFFLAGAVKGVLGLGLPTVAMGLLGLAMAPAEAAALLLVPSLVTNVVQLAAGPAFGPIARRLAGMMLGVAAGTVAAAGVLTAGAGAASVALGAVLAVYGVVGLAKPRLRVAPRAEPWAGPVVGVATGLVTGPTGVFVVPAVPYLSALGFSRDELVQALGLSFTVSTVALAAGLAWHGALSGGAAGASILALAPALVGMAAGTRLRDKIRPEVFRRGFFTALILLGAELAWTGLG